ncbi:MAG: M48 family metalloprotease, partial [Bdellovibrionales bacterium]|nr:M48 family metalloprotease [Bdellovibrionales bacterium]
SALKKTKQHLDLEKILDQWISTKAGRRSFLLSLPLLYAACSTPSHRNREGDNAGQETTLSIADEKRMTAEVLPEMQREYPPVQDSEVQNYLSGLGRKIVNANGLEGQPYNYTFTAVDTKMVNAFALPAGTVMVTAPLITMAETEAELAGVIGHEIGHVKARHTAERMDRQKDSESKGFWYKLGGGVIGGAAGFGIGKLMCPPQDNACLAKATAVGVGAGVVGGLLVTKYAFMANSREDEMEADRIGFRTALKAGFAREHVGTFYSKLLKIEQEQKAKGGGNSIVTSISDAMSTHPPSQERVNQMKIMVSQVPQSKNAVVSSREFEKIKGRVQQLIQKKGSQS